MSKNNCSENDLRIVQECKKLNVGDCLKAVIYGHLIENVRYKQILVLVTQQGLPEALQAAIGWPTDKKKNNSISSLVNMVKPQEVSTSPTVWLCLLLLMKKTPENAAKADPGLVAAMEHCYSLCVTHGCDTGDPWVPWMLPFLPEKHTVDLRNLLITALYTRSAASAADIVENIDTMQVVQGVVLFFDNPTDDFFKNVFKPGTGTPWNAHALNLWISLLILLDVTEGYQVYLECRKWAKKEPADTTEQITQQTAEFKREVQKHLSNIDLPTGHPWKLWQINFLGLLVGNNVFPLVENIEQTELFRTKEFFHKLLIGQLTKTAIEQNKKRTPSKDAHKDAHQFTPKKTDTVNTESANWWGRLWGSARGVGATMYAYVYDDQTHIDGMVRRWSDHNKP